MKRKAIDFNQLVNQVNKPQVGQESLAIWGGTCAEGTVEDFLASWPLERMPYRIWESTDRIDFGKNTPVPNVTLLERGRIFGSGGDLDLRREGAAFAWRFVGPAGVQPSAGDYGAQDYWVGHPQVTFHQREETALLWGKRDGEKWADDRVGAATLNYPATGERVQVHYTTFSRAGRVEFVWLTGLREWKEADNG